MNNITAYIDETCWDKQVALCLVVIDNESNLKVTKEALSKLKSDVVVQISKKETEPLHYVKDNIATRLHVLNILHDMPVSVYFFVGTYDNIKNEDLRKRKAYEIGLPLIVKPILAKYKKYTEFDMVFQMMFENITNKYATDKRFFTECLSGLLDEPSIQIIDKSNQLNMLPDYFAGILRALYVKQKSHTHPCESMRVIADKIGLILIDKPNLCLKHHSRGEGVNEFIKSFC